ncbi:hypothetical protein GDO81_015800 [Engystomops pustulosus]|uniref:Fanconi anemia core complex-associated protein 24 n=1 Tax=Engystomops pustulosus TaxID=76066 RepID=A0AAV7AXA6_ENGPU|nr:hypothetical protein GDO81_015800 [Engystomops pustulosus]
MSATQSTPVRAGASAVPYGHVIGSEKWRGTQLAHFLQGKVKLVFEDGLGLVDFHMSNRACVLYISESDLVSGNAFKRRLVRFRKVQERSREGGSNPFISKKRCHLSEASILQTVQRIPGVGRVKALQLLQYFPSIQQLSNASLRDLEAVVGRGIANNIHLFFTET